MLPDTATEREKSEERLAQGSCGPCHQTFDPVAYAFEPYDGSGRYRTEDESGGTLRTDGWVPAEFGAFPDGDPRGETVPYDDLDGLVDALVASPVVESCLSENVLMFALRRVLEDGVVDDQCTIREVTEAARASGGSYAELMVAVATHPMFASVRGNR